MRKLNIQKLISNDEFIDWVNNPNISNSVKWLELIDESEDNKNRIEEAKEIVVSFNTTVGNEFLEEVTNEEIKNQWQSIIDKSLKKKNPFTWVKYAAAIIVAIAVLGSVLQTQFSKTAIDTNTFDAITLTLDNGDILEIDEKKDVIISTEDGGVISTKGGSLSLAKSSIATNIRWQSIKVPKGRKISIILSDGTTVKLNSDTQFTYPDNFIGENRTVKLIGEAFFEVEHNKEKPFIVENSLQNITVLGTKFNISCYANDRKIKTTLTEGSVKIESKLNKSSIVLLPGEQGVLSVNNAQLTKNKIDVNRPISWLNDVLYFNNEEIEDLSNKIERWYNVKITFNNDDIKTVHFTGVLRKEKSIDHILSLIEKTSSIKITRVNNEIIFN